MAQLTTPPRDYPGLAESVQRQISSGNHECTGCTPAVDGVTPEVCYSMCLTTCEHSRLAELQFGPGSYTSADLDSQIAEGMSPKSVRHGADGELAALTRKLDAQGAEQKALASQVDGMKRQLDKVVSLLEAKA